MYQGNIFLLCFGGKAIWESRGFKGIFSICCFQGIYLDNKWWLVRSSNACEAFSICSDHVQELSFSAPCPLHILFRRQCQSQHCIKAQPSKSWVRDELSSFSCSEHGLLSVEWVPSSFEPCFLSAQSSSSTHSLLAPPVDSSRLWSTYLSFPLRCPLRWVVGVGTQALVT